MFGNGLPPTKEPLSLDHILNSTAHFFQGEKVAHLKDPLYPGCGCMLLGTPMG